MRRYREPAAILFRPAIGVATVGLLTVRGGVAGAAVDDGEVAQHPNLDIVSDEIPDRHRHRGLFQESGTVDKRFVWVGAIKILRQNFVEASDVGILYRGDVVAVEAGQVGKVVWHRACSAVRPSW